MSQHHSLVFSSCVASVSCLSYSRGPYHILLVCECCELIEVTRHFSKLEFPGGNWEGKVLGIVR